MDYTLHKYVIIFYILSEFINMIVYCIMSYLFIYFVFNTVQLIFDWSHLWTNEICRSAEIYFIGCEYFPLDTWEDSLWSRQLDYSPCRDNTIHFMFWILPLIFSASSRHASGIFRLWLWLVEFSSQSFSSNKLVQQYNNEHPCPSNRNLHHGTEYTLFTVVDHS